MRNQGIHRQRSGARSAQAAPAEAAAQAGARAQRREGEVRAIAEQALAAGAAAGASRDALPERQERPLDSVRLLSHAEVMDLRWMYGKMVASGLSDEQARSVVGEALVAKRGPGSAYPEWHAMRAAVAPPRRTLSWGASFDSFGRLMCSKVGDIGTLLHELRVSLMYELLSCVRQRGLQPDLRAALQDRLRVVQNLTMKRWRDEMKAMTEGPLARIWRNQENWKVVEEIATSHPLARAMVDACRFFVDLDKDASKAFSGLKASLSAFAEEMLLEHPQNREATLRSWSEQLLARLGDSGADVSQDLLKEMALQLLDHGHEWTAQIEDPTQRDLLSRGVERLVQGLQARPECEAARLLVLWLQMDVFGGGWKLASQTLTEEQRQARLRLLPIMLPLLLNMRATHEVWDQDLGFLILLGMAMGATGSSETTLFAIENLAIIPGVWSEEAVPALPVIYLSEAQATWLEVATAMNGGPQAGRAALARELLILNRLGVTNLIMLRVPSGPHQSPRFWVWDFIVEQLARDPTFQLPLTHSFERWLLRGIWLEEQEGTPLPESLQPSEEEIWNYLGNFSARAEVVDGIVKADVALHDALFMFCEMAVLPPETYPVDRISQLIDMWEGCLMGWLRWAPESRLQPLLTKLAGRSSLGHGLARRLLHSRAPADSIDCVRRIETLMTSGANCPRAILKWAICDSQGLIAPLTDSVRDRMGSYLRKGALGQSASATPLRLAPLVQQTLEANLSARELDARLKTVALLAERQFQPAVEISFGPEIWEQLSSSARIRFLGRPQLCSKITLDLWLAWILSDDRFCQEAALQQAGLIPGSTGALMRAWCAPRPHAEAGEHATGGRETGRQQVSLSQETRIIEFLDRKSGELDLFNFLDVSGIQLASRLEPLCAPCQGGRSRWVNWSLADAKGRLRKQPSAALDGVSEQLLLSPQDFTWLLEAAGDPRTSLTALPRVQRLVARGAMSYPGLWKHWWQSLSKEAIPNAMAMMRLASPGSEGRAKLLQHVWHQTLPAAVVQSIVDDLMQLPDEELLAITEQVPLDPSKLRAPAAQFCQRSLLGRLAQAWSCHADPIAWGGLLHILDASTQHNPFVSGSAPAEQLCHPRLGELMEQPLEGGLSRWLVWWLQGSQGAIGETWEISNLPLIERQLPWRLSPADVDWILEKLAAQPSCLLEQPLAQALVKASEERGAWLVQWLRDLRAQGSAAFMVLALSLWQAGLPMDDQDRHALLAYVGAGQPLPIGGTAIVGELILSWSDKDLLGSAPALKGALHATHSWLAKETKRDLRIRYDAILKAASGQSNPMASSRSPQSGESSSPSPTSTPRSAQVSPTAEASAAALPELLLHPRFLKQFQKLGPQGQAAVRDWLRDLAETGRPSKEVKTTMLPGGWSHAHITAVNPWLVVAYRMNRDSAKIDWVMSHGNEYNSDRSRATWERWRDRDQQKPPEYSREQP